MELLVVISVVALLLAVLMPSLQKAKEMAGRMVCANHQRQLSLANNLYAGSWDEQFCPPMMENRNAKRSPPPDERRYIWLSNPDFQKFMALDDQAEEGVGTLIMPDEYFCPADKVARYDKVSVHDVLVSYAYNVAEWYYPEDLIDCFWQPCCACTSEENPTWQIGHKRTAIPRASEKINFVDSVDWWGTWQKGANYEIAWDVLGQVQAHPPSRPNYADDADVYGPVIYRHNEGANFAFYDGHVAHLSKEEAYIEKQGVSPLQDATGMWYVSRP